MAITIVFTYKDDKDTKAQMIINVADAADYVAAADRLQLLLDPLTGAQLVDCHAVIGIPLADGLKTAAAASSAVEEGGKFIWNVAGGFRTAFQLPAINESVLVAATPFVDRDLPVVGALIAGMMTDATGIYGVPVVGLDRAGQAFSKARV